MTHIDEIIQSKNYSLKSSLSYFHFEFQVSRNENVAPARRVVEKKYCSYPLTTTQA